jgi:pimeloyl-ACP methyl ester carboxylesterase
MQVVVQDLVTNCDLSGKGKLVLLLHGWGDNLHGLRNLHKTLSSKYQVLSLDLPGFGNTDAPTTVWGLDEYGKFVAALLKKLELKQPYAVIGHSNGGAIAIRMVAQGLLNPERIILIAASGIRSDQSVRRLAFQVIAKTGNIATAWLPERYRGVLRRSLYGAAGSDLYVMPQLQETFKKTVRQDVQVDAEKIHIPTLLIYARDDDIVPLSYGRRYHHLINDSILAIIESGGHFVHQKQPTQVLEHIERFLA